MTNLIPTSHPLSIGSNNHNITSNPLTIAETYTSIALRDADTTFNGNSSNLFKTIAVVAIAVTYYRLDSIAPTWTLVSWPTYQNIAERDADTAFNGVMTNIGKAVRVESSLAFFILTSTTPTWLGLAGTSIDSPPVIVNVQFTPEVNYIFYDGWIVQENITLNKGSIFAVVPPTGSAIIVDILINGSAQARLLTLPVGISHQLTDITDLVVTAGQRVGLKFTQIGSTNPGNGIVVTLHQVLT